MSPDLIEIDDARDAVLGRVTPLPAEPVPLDGALSRVLAGPVVSDERVPGFDNSAMDGFAVRVADLSGAGHDNPVRLPIRDESRAGRPAAGAHKAGGATAISTGAVLPDGADAVVRVEDTRPADDGESIHVLIEPGEGANIRRAGEDVEPGTELMEPGGVVGAAELGVLASVGARTVECRQRPGVSVISTGDELIGVEDELRPGAVRNSNSLSLPALAAGAGAVVDSVGRAADDLTDTVDALGRGLNSDVLVVCGGVSVGAHDHVKPALAELGVEQHFWGVSLKPGKPTFFGSRGGTLVFGLPGNPVSAYVTFILFVRPALRALQGADADAARTLAALTEPYEKPADRGHAARCSMRLGPEGWLATPAARQGSHVMTALLSADALALIPTETTRLEAGERVAVELLP